MFLFIVSILISLSPRSFFESHLTSSSLPCFEESQTKQPFFSSHFTQDLLKRIEIWKRLPLFATFLGDVYCDRLLIYDPVTRLPMGCNFFAHGHSQFSLSFDESLHFMINDILYYQKYQQFIDDSQSLQEIQLMWAELLHLREYKHEWGGDPLFPRYNNPQYLAFCIIWLHRFFPELITQIDPSIRNEWIRYTSSLYCSQTDSFTFSFFNLLKHSQPEELYIYLSIMKRNELLLLLDDFLKNPTLYLFYPQPPPAPHTQYDFYYKIARKVPNQPSVITNKVRSTLHFFLLYFLKEEAFFPIPPLQTLMEVYQPIQWTHLNVNSPFLSLEGVPMEHIIVYGRSFTWIPSLSLQKYLKKSGLSVHIKIMSSQEDEWDFLGGRIMNLAQKYVKEQNRLELLDDIPTSWGYYQTNQLSFLSLFQFLSPHDRQLVLMKLSAKFRIVSSDDPHVQKRLPLKLHIFVAPLLYSTYFDISRSSPLTQQLLQKYDPQSTPELVTQRLLQMTQFLQQNGIYTGSMCSLSHMTHNFITSPSEYERKTIINPSLFQTSFSLLHLGAISNSQRYDKNSPIEHPNIGSNGLFRDWDDLFLLAETTPIWHSIVYNFNYRSPLQGHLTNAFLLNSYSEPLFALIIQQLDQVVTQPDILDPQSLPHINLWFKNFLDACHLKLQTSKDTHIEHLLPYLKIDLSRASIRNDLCPKTLWNIRQGNREIFGLPSCDMLFALINLDLIKRQIEVNPSPSQTHSFCEELLHILCLFQEEALKQYSYWGRWSHANFTFRVNLHYYEKDLKETIQLFKEGLHLIFLFYQKNYTATDQENLVTFLLKLSTHPIFTLNQHILDQDLFNRRQGIKNRVFLQQYIEQFASLIFDSSVERLDQINLIPFKLPPQFIRPSQSPPLLHLQHLHSLYDLHLISC